MEGEANFAVIEDLAKKQGEVAKFLLFFWEDLGTSGFPLGDRVAQSETWSNVKGLYR